MRRRFPILGTAVFLVLSCSGFLNATPGTFRGVVIASSVGKHEWIYLKSSNGMVRRVGIRNAQVVYSETVPSAERKKVPESSIAPGAELRVTAELDDGGEWRASRIEILSLHANADIPAPSERLPLNRT